MRKIIGLLALFFVMQQLPAQTKPAKKIVTQTAETKNTTDSNFKSIKWRNIGPFRGGRSVTATGVVGNPLVYYMGTTGGGVWKTYDAGGTWQNISDGFMKTGSVGAVSVSESDPNVVFVGMGEHAPRGVMTSYGDGVYKSTDAGKTWKKMGLDLTRQIAAIRIHPTNPDIVYVAAQGALNGPSEERGVYKSVDGGVTWKKTLFVDNGTGCSDLSLDMQNPRILYAAMWEHQRLPWEMKSGGKGSGLYKSTDGGETWSKIEKGLPKGKGKMAVEVSRSNPDKVYALVEGDTEKEEGGLFVSNDAGKAWNRISKDHRLVQRAWYYIEIAVDPLNENTVYVFNSPGLRSMDGGKSWSNIRGTHGDYHQLWINPANSKNMIIANDGGAAVSFNTGKTWSTQNNQPTAQIYRINADNLFPYNIYGGQQDNTSIKIASRSLNGYSISDRDWSYSAGGESAFMAFNPDDPRFIMGGSYQGTIEVLDQQIKEGKYIMATPIQYQSLQPKNMKYRFNWNAPILNSPNDRNIFYHAGNVLLRTADKGMHWEAISPDLTRHDTAKMGQSGVPFTNEGAGGENYGTIAYVNESAHEKGVIYTGSDDGLVYITKDNGKTWNNITPAAMGEMLVNCIEVSPYDKATVYIASTKYKMNDLSPALYKSTDYGKTWSNISKGIPYGAYTRCIREDDLQKDLLYAGTETGFYISSNGGKSWKQQQLNLPVTPITDLKVHQGNLIASTMGRSFWILDDLSILRQYMARDVKKTFELFTPETAYRVSGGSVLDGATDDEDGPALAYNFGVNAASGVPLYYLLPAGADSLAVTLEIQNEKGKMVRKYSSKPDSKFVGFPGGPEEEPLLPAKAGMNRMVWDQRYATLPGVPNVFIEGSYAGRKAAPGKYKAILKAGKEEKTTTIMISADPRIQATQADYNAQEQTLLAVDDSIKSIHDKVNQMKVVRNQVNSLLDILTDTLTYKAVIDSGKSLNKQITTWEEKLVQPKAQSNDDIINFVNMLSADYIFLKGEMDSNIPFVTGGQQNRINELNALWQPLLNEYDQIQKKITAFNALCREKGVEKITVPGIQI
ncbi:MAG: glycosyl hydrolase [Bacteroidota bacterium]